MITPASQRSLSKLMTGTRPAPRSLVKRLPGPTLGSRLLLSHLMPALAHGRAKLHSLFQQAFRLLGGAHHFLHRLEDVARAEIKAAVKALHRTVDLVVAQAGIRDGALLITRFVEQRIDRQVTVPGHVFEQLGARIRG